MGIDIAVALDEGRPEDIRFGEEGELLLGLRGRQRVALDAEALGLTHAAPDLAPPRRR